MGNMWSNFKTFYSTIHNIRDDCIHFFTKIKSYLSVNVNSLNVNGLNVNSLNVNSLNLNGLNLNSLNCLNSPTTKT